MKPSALETARDDIARDAGRTPAGSGRPVAHGRDLTQGAIAKTLLAFSLPALGSTVLQSLNASVNAVWIGHGLGEAALAAVSNANLLLFFLLGVVFGMSMANTILVGQAMGARNIEQVKRTVGTSVVFFGALSVAIAAIGFAETPAILAAMRTPAEAVPLAVAYLRVIFIALPSMYLYNFLMMALRGAGDAKTPLLFMLLSVGLDIALNPLFIFGWGPLPALGIQGSALATLVAQTASLAAMIVTLQRRRHVISLQRGERAYLRLDGTIVKALIAKGVPMGLQMLVIASSALVMVAYVNVHGALVTAAYGVASQLWTYIQMPALTIGASVSAMAAQNIGAGLWARVERVTTTGIVFNLVATGTLVALVMLFERGSLGIFLPAESGAIAIAQHINAIVAWTFVLFGVTIVLFGTIRANGAVLAPLVILVISMWGVRLPMAGLLQARFGAEAIWWSFAVGAGVSLVLSSLYFRFGHWRAARLLPPPDGRLANSVARR